MPAHSYIFLTIWGKNHFDPWSGYNMTIDIARRDTPVYALRKCLTPAHSQNLESLYDRVH